MAIDLKDIMTISGHSGLFKSIAASQQGLVLESLDEQKKRSIKQIQRYDISSLEDIGIYTTGEEDTMLLSTIFWRLYAELGGAVSTELYDTPGKLQGLMKQVLPTYDPTRVYQSNIQKVFRWYNILVEYAPELFREAQETLSADPH